MNCRFCKSPLKTVFIDLINSPPSNAFLTAEQLNEPEVFFPLNIFVCEKCFLVQVDEYKKSADTFDSNYAYFSSYSKTWLEHCKNYTDMMTKRFDINPKSLVVEVASNDGYLLQFFKDKGIPVLGVEPTSNTAKVAIGKGIETIEKFFGVSLAKELSKRKKADLMVGNNVLAHVPDINDFVEGFKILLGRTGVITFEFPHLMQLVENNQFDTIYHEHYSYLSFLTVNRIFDKHGLEIFDVEEIPTHGGSLRVFVKHKEDKTKEISDNVSILVEKEKSKGMDGIKYYSGFQEKADKVKYDLLTFLLEQKAKGKTVAAYGAAAKGNTLLNYCGIKKDLISFVVDASPHKQGLFLPASHIPVVKEDMLRKTKPDFIIILPWNLKAEITEQLKYVKTWGCGFVIPIPKLQIV